MINPPETPGGPVFPGKLRAAVCLRASEFEAERKLQVPRHVALRRYLPERSAGGAGVGVGEIHLVEHVQSFKPDLQAGALLDRRSSPTRSSAR